MSSLGTVVAVRIVAQDRSLKPQNIRTMNSLLMARLNATTAARLFTTPHTGTGICSVAVSVRQRQWRSTNVKMKGHVQTRHAAWVEASMSELETFRALALQALSRADHHRQLASTWEGEQEHYDHMRIAESYMEQGKILLAEAKELEANDE